MAKVISFVLFLFVGTYSFADCTTSMVSSPVLGEVYFKVHVENFDDLAIFVDAFKENGTQVKSYRGYPVDMSVFGSLLQWTAQSVYEIEETKQEIKLDSASLGIVKFSGTDWVSLLFSLDGGAINPVICD